jgi:hypothetical protein
VTEEMKEEKSIQDFVDIWYSDSTRRNLQAIKIRA